MHSIAEFEIAERKLGVVHMVVKSVEFRLVNFIVLFDFRIETIERFDFTRLGPEDACGFAALNGALCAGDRKRWRIKRIDLRNSGDTSGDRSRVVGYGAWALSQTSPAAA